MDSSSSRETLKMIHILAKHGAKWMPTDRSEINNARGSLLKMKDDYTVEFVWIMARYNGCSRERVVQLLRTPKIRRHVAQHQPRIDELLEDFPQSQESESHGSPKME